jgi:hypothetical protein
MSIFSICTQLPHVDHPRASSEIAKLQLADHCRKRAADDETPLRQLFDNICRESPDVGAVQQLSYAAIESSMYKRRRLAQPRLPTSVSEASSIVSTSRYAKLNDGDFFRCQVDAGENGTALLFVVDKQLELLQSASSIYYDATFKVVPRMYYQLFTVFTPHGDCAFPVFYALRSRKTTDLYRQIFLKLKELAPQFKPANAMADFEEASSSAFQAVFGSDISISGCWFHYAQAVVKRMQKMGLKAVYQQSDMDVQDTVHCLLSLPLLPAADISSGLDDVRSTITADGPLRQQLEHLCMYVQHQWIAKRSIGPDRLSVSDSRSRTNNVLESYHASLRRRVQVSHPNLFSFLGHLQRATVDYMHDAARVSNGLTIRRPKKKSSLLNESRIKMCISRFNSGAYNRLQFLKAVSHSMGAHLDEMHLHTSSDNTDDNNDDEQDEQEEEATTGLTSTAQSSSGPDTDDRCEVCLIAQRNSHTALVPCGHARFCADCITTLTTMGQRCPICRSDITMVIQIYN